MDIDPDEMAAGPLEHLVNSVVIPRPIGWVTTQGRDGVFNLGPFSYFNMVSSVPPVAMLGFSPHGKKDSLQNIRATGEFVINVATHELRHPMVASSAEVDIEVDEIELVGLEAAPSVVVAPPRLAAARAVLECRVEQITPVYDSVLVLGRVVHIHVDDEVMRSGRVIAELLAPVARLGGAYYTTVTDSYRIDRPKTLDPETVRARAAGPDEARGAGER